METEWRATTIGALCNKGLLVTQTGPFGSQLHAHDYQPTGVPVVPTEAIGRRTIRDEGLPRVSPETAERLSRHRLRAGDILFARRGVQATGLSALVRQHQQGWLCGTGAILLRTLSNTIDPEFLSFFLSADNSIDWLKTHAVGAVMPNLNESVIRDFPMSLPPLPEQRAIARILGALDDKIELNRRMNETLEAMARALFQSWFVDFDPVRAKAEGRQPAGMDADTAALFPDAFEDSPLGEIPRGWRIGQIHDLASISRDALDPAQYPAETFSHYSIPAYDDGGIPREEAGADIKSNKFLVLPGAVLVSKLNPHIPRVWLPPLQHSRRSVCSTEFLVTLPRHGVTREYLYALLASAWFRDIFGTLVTGTSNSHQRVKPDDLLHIDIVVPNQAAIAAFTNIVSPLHARAEAHLQQTQTLAAIRDALLPKLLSGEVRVREAEELITQEVIA